MPQFNTYRVSYHSSHTNNMRAMIRCYDSSDQVVAYMTFYDDGTPPPTPDGIEGSNIVHMNFPTSLFGDVVTILRDEGPYLTASSGSPYLPGISSPGGGFAIWSGPEPIGDEEVHP